MFIVGFGASVIAKPEKSCRDVVPDFLFFFFLHTASTPAAAETAAPVTLDECSQPFLTPNTFNSRHELTNNDPCIFVASPNFNLTYSSSFTDNHYFYSDDTSEFTIKFVESFDVSGCWHQKKEKNS